ncbi:hypothetical protein Q5P01_004588 [Channa striata]|uniref:Uncharacterized protein n=1 Tax=Channa striata TaxID=64152 RepID=A0AA88NB37_CHASR|nr:hypothetical protein Q5P01_004588 [Channa striata]
MWTLLEVIPSSVVMLEQRLAFWFIHTLFNNLSSSVVTLDLELPVASWTILPFALCDLCWTKTSRTSPKVELTTSPSRKANPDRSGISLRWTEDFELHRGADPETQLPTTE